MADSSTTLERGAALPGESIGVPAGADPADVPAVVLAGFVRRVAAFTLDSLLVFGVIIAALVISGASYTQARWVGMVTPLVLFPLYFVSCEAVFDGRTLGKALLGIGVRRSDGSHPRVLRLAAREGIRGVFWVLMIVPFVVDHLWALAAHRLTLHDRAADTVVVDRNPAAHTTDRWLLLLLGVLLAPIVLLGYGSWSVMHQPGGVLGARLPFADSFSGSCQWPQWNDATSSSTCANGGLQLMIKAPHSQPMVGLPLWLGQLRPVDSVSVSGTAQLAAPALLTQSQVAAYGVQALNSKPGAAARGYDFMVFSNGEWGIFRHDEQTANPQTMRVLAHGRDPHLVAPTHIAVTGLVRSLPSGATRLTLLLNHRQVGRVVDANGLRGFTGFGFMGAANTPATIHFDNFNAHTL